MARALWRQVLTRSLAMVATYNDATSCADLFMLPRCVLSPHPRRGRKHQRAAAAYTLDRLWRWHEGECLELWSSNCKPPPGRARGPTDDSKRSVAERLAREGFDRKACAALLATGLCPETAATAAAFRGLHPPGRLVPPPPNPPPAIEVALDSVHRALRHFPLDSAPGLSDTMAAPAQRLLPSLRPQTFWEGSTACCEAPMRNSRPSTRRRAHSQGIRFRPMVAESTRAGKQMHPTFCCSCPVGQLPEREVTLGALHACLLQGLCVGIRASHARAVLSRRAAVAASTMDTTTRQIALHGAMEE